MSSFYSRWKEPELNWLWCVVIIIRRVRYNKGTRMASQKLLVASPPLLLLPLNLSQTQQANTKFTLKKENKVFSLFQMDSFVSSAGAKLGGEWESKNFQILIEVRWNIFLKACSVSLVFAISEFFFIFIFWQIPYI